jgi:hypothetical protein
MHSRTVPNTARIETTHFDPSVLIMDKPLNSGSCGLISLPTPGTGIEDEMVMRLERIFKIALSFGLAVLFLAEFDGFARQRKTASSRHSRSSGGSGQESVMDGLCIQRNSGQPQNSSPVNGRTLCATLRSIVDDKNSCAHKKIEEMISSHQPNSQMEQFCPTYKDLKTQYDLYFQTLAAMAWFETRWNPNAADGDHGRSQGLMQINPKDWQNPDYSSGCQDTKKFGTHDARANLECGSCIAMVNMAKDHEFGSGHAGKSDARGIARYFSPLGDQSSNKTKLATALSSYCVASTKDQVGGPDLYANTGGGTVQTASSTAPAAATASRGFFSRMAAIMSSGPIVATP